MEYYNFNNPSLTEKKLHFIAANGFHPATYKQIFNSITLVSVQSPLMRPLWNPSPPAVLDSWMQFADDLRPYIEEFQPKVVMGHSIGAIIWLLFSIKYDYSFEKIIMIDPALFPRWMYRVYQVLYKLKFHKKFHPLIKTTLKRKQEFSSKKDIMKSYGQKKIFSKINHDVLEDYIDSGFKKENEKFLLSYSPDWESIIYEKGMLDDWIIWEHLENISRGTEIVYIKGELSHICTKSVTDRLLKLCSHFYSYEIPDTTHLLPFEEPGNIRKILKIHLEN